VNDVNISEVIVFDVLMKCFVDDVCDEGVFSLSIVGARSSIYQFPFTTEIFQRCDLKCRRRESIIKLISLESLLN
jgi:hypothetical protein